MDVLVSRTRETKGYDIKAKAAYDASEDLTTAERNDAAALLDGDKAVILAAGQAIDAAQATTTKIVADLQRVVREDLGAAIELVSEAMDEAQAIADVHLVVRYPFLPCCFSRPYFRPYFRGRETWGF
eukprot:SAG11_NODE_332_length_10621_cov_13.178768_5_plen_127_part_00